MNARRIGRWIGQAIGILLGSAVRNGLLTILFLIICAIIVVSFGWAALLTFVVGILVGGSIVGYAPDIYVETREHKVRPDA